MHDGLTLISTIAAAFGLALVLGFLAVRLGLPALVGYLVAGVFIGPHSPGFVADASIAGQLSEIGVMLLMFGVGLHFHLQELLAVRKVAVPGALVQIAAATGLGMLLTSAFGWSWGAGLVFGLAISVASTVVLLRVLSDNGSLHTPSGHVAVGWLIVEDLFTVLVLVLLPVFSSNDAGASTGDTLLSIATAVLKLVALCLLSLVVGKRVIPWLLGYVARTRSRELFTLTVLVLALGIAVGSAKLFGASMAL